MGIQQIYRLCIILCLLLFVTIQVGAQDSTKTPVSTPTATQTATLTATASATSSPTATATIPPTQTATLTSTASVTSVPPATETATATHTAVATETATDDLTSQVQSMGVGAQQDGFVSISAVDYLTFIGDFETTALAFFERRDTSPVLAGLPNPAFVGSGASAPPLITGSYAFTEIRNQSTPVTMRLSVTVDFGGQTHRIRDFDWGILWRFTDAGDLSGRTFEGYLQYEDLSGNILATSNTCSIDAEAPTTCFVNNPYSGSDVARATVFLEESGMTTTGRFQFVIDTITIQTATLVSDATATPTPAPTDSVCPSGSGTSSQEVGTQNDDTCPDPSPTPTVTATPTATPTPTPLPDPLPIIIPGADAMNFLTYPIPAPPMDDLNVALGIVNNAMKSQDNLIVLWNRSFYGTCNSSNRENCSRYAYATFYAFFEVYTGRSPTIGEWLAASYARELGTWGSGYGNVPVQALTRNFFTSPRGGCTYAAQDNQYVCEYENIILWTADIQFWIDTVVNEGTDLVRVNISRMIGFDFSRIEELLVNAEKPVSVEQLVSLGGEIGMFAYDIFIQDPILDNLGIWRTGQGQDVPSTWGNSVVETGLTSKPAIYDSDEHFAPLVVHLFSSGTTRGWPNETVNFNGQTVNCSYFAVITTTQGRLTNLSTC